VSTVDIAEVRRRLDRYVTRAAVGAGTLLDADTVLAYMPMLLDEVEQLRQQAREDAAAAGDA
jgi:hypothetical protein